MTQNELGSPPTDIPSKINFMMAHTSLTRKFEAQRYPERFRFEPCHDYKKHPQRFHNTKKRWGHKSKLNQPFQSMCGDFHSDKQKDFLNRCRNDRGSLFY